MLPEKDRFTVGMASKALSRLRFLDRGAICDDAEFEIRQNPE